jgi:sugar lactone lactonase YvrE
VDVFTAEVLFRPDSVEIRFLPEGPIDLGGGRFSWVAIQHGAEATAGSLNVYDMDAGRNESFPLKGRPGFALPTSKPGEFLIGMERRLCRFDTASGHYEVVAEGIDTDVEGTIVNDGVAATAGVIFGTKDLNFQEKKAGLYFWRERDGKLFQLRDDQICSNGKVVVSSDQGVDFLDIDTPTKQVVSYHLDVETGTLSTPRVVLDLADVDGFPDGMVATPDGRGVIIAFYNPEKVPFGETRRYALHSGRCEAVWRTPASPRATCPLLIEYGGSVKLVITTAVEGMSEQGQSEATNAGSLFIADFRE